MYRYTFILLGLSLFFSTIDTAPSPKKKSFIKEITSMSEFQDVINNKRNTCIIFYAPWCHACNSMKDIFNEGAEKYNGTLDFIKVDASNEKLKDAADMFGIRAIPTIFFKHVGTQTKDQFLKNLQSFTQPPELKSEKVIKPIKKGTIKKTVPPAQPKKIIKKQLKKAV